MHRDDWCQTAKTWQNQRITNRIEFWLSCLGYAVGYGNVWRFPYMLYSNGGGVFFIPFWIWIFVFWYPIYYLEIAYGKCSKYSVHAFFELIRPRFIGQSFAITTTLFLEAVLFMTLLAWCCTFFLFSLQDPLPWAVDPSYSEDGQFWNEDYFKDTFLK